MTIIENFGAKKPSHFRAGYELKYTKNERGLVEESRNFGLYSVQRIRADELVLNVSVVVTVTQRQMWMWSWPPCTDERRL